jgi:dipeptidyl aminopeptidase/acylaminoacyl peptidase
MEREGHPELRRFDLRRSVLDPAAIPLPRPATEVVDYLPERGLALLRSGRGSDGPFLWAVGARDARRTLVALNPQLENVIPAPRRLIEYRSSDGDLLKGLVLLPPGHRDGMRHPLAVWVYGGSVVRDTMYGAAAFPNEVQQYNPQILAAHGYAVLFPSVPLDTVGAPSDPYIDIPKGVMPAIDRAVELGLADPARVAVIGYSYGGYSVYCLVTYSHRFAAAVGFAGLSDLVSIYGTFDPRQRYEAGPYGNLAQATLAEGGQLRMGGAPWQDLWHYMRNSPISYVDRVETPLMIIQGDLDYVPIQQGEELFSALNRRGVPVRFVRYWGEGHGVTAVSHIRDMWEQIFAWFGKYLGESGSGG